MPESLIERRKRKLACRLAGSERRFVTAESCTGGALAGLLAGDAELGPHLERGFVAYSVDAKCEQLDVPRADAERCGAVNREVALAMAAGALAHSKADLAVAITGFCGPQEGHEEVGLVFIALHPRSGEAIWRDYHFGDIGRQSVLDAAVAAALALMIDAIR